MERNMETVWEERSMNRENKSSSELAIVDEHTLRDKIYIVRGVKIMLDFELAEIYGYTTTAFNQQVKNNSDKFEGDDFCFYLTQEEFKNLMSKFFTSSWGGRRKTPRAFTGNRLHQRDYTDFHTEFPGIAVKFLNTGGIMHDRFIVLDFGTSDEKMFHCGASSKDAGVSKMTAITELTDAAVRSSFHNVVSQLLSNPPLNLR